MNNEKTNDNKYFKSVEGKQYIVSL